MRCRSEKQVPKCFKSVSCPYPMASTAHGAYGAINYLLVGPPTGELVVCLHGLNGSRVLFQELGTQLSTQGGFRVLSYDLYGHGLSNAPMVDLCACRGCRRCSETVSCGTQRARYDLDFFIEQIEDLLAILGLEDDKINLVGFSLGGTIAVAFSQRYPQRVSRLVAMSPAGFLPKVPVSYHLLKAVWCCLIPAAPHVLCTCWYKKERFAKSFQGQDADSDVIDNLWRRFVWQLYVKRGVASATLAACHRIPWFKCKPIFQDAGRDQRPVLLIWGEKDSLNPVQTVAQEVKNCFTNAQLMVVPGAGHISMCDRPKQTIFSILTFLKLPDTTRMDSVDVMTLPQQPRRVSGTPAETLQGRTLTGSSGTGSSGISLSCSHSAPLSAPMEERRLAAASQMPVPMIFGHTEDTQEDPNAMDL